MANSKKVDEDSNFKVYVNDKKYSKETYELREIFAKECIIIPYTLYYQKIKDRLPKKAQDLIDTYKSLTYAINDFKKRSSKCYEKVLVSYIKKLAKYDNNPDKLKKQLSSGNYAKYYNKFTDPNHPEYKKYKQYIAKKWKNHPVYKEAKTFYNNLEKRKELKDKYLELDEKILEKCKQIWLKHYKKNHERINPVARDRFWELARGLVSNTIDQLYTMDIKENKPDLVDETLGRIYEGLMCFFDSNYKIDTFIYSVTMSRVSAYERARVKKTDAPELFHNMDDVEIKHNYYGFTNPKLTPILEGSSNMFVARHLSWVTSKKEILANG